MVQAILIFKKPDYSIYKKCKSHNDHKNAYRWYTKENLKRGWNHITVLNMEENRKAETKELQQKTEKWQ